MYSEHVFLVLFLLIVIGLFVRSFNHGVVNLLCAVAGVCGGLIGGWLFFGLLPDLLPDWEAGLRTRLFLSALIAVIPYLVVRMLAKAVLGRLLDGESPLGFLGHGIGGAMLSLIPSLMIVGVIITCVRTGGTWADLRRFEKLSTGIEYYAERYYPGRPLLAQWRDAIERLPMVRELFDSFDWINRVPERNLVGLLITSKKEDLRDHLAEGPESALILTSGGFGNLLEDPEVSEMNEARAHFSLLHHDAVRSLAANPELRPDLEMLELHTLVDDFMLSPERQSYIKSIERR